MSNDDMKLPEGKSCVDCRSYRRCRDFIGERHINAQATHCDWAPSRFVDAKAYAERDQRLREAAANRPDPIATAVVAVVSGVHKS